MSREYTAKSFKSGNSVAIRMPAGLGIEPDREWTVAKDANGDLIIRSKAAVKRKFNIEKVWGIGRDLGIAYMKPEDRVFDERILPWDDPAWLAEIEGRDGDKP